MSPQTVPDKVQHDLNGFFCDLLKKNFGAIYAINFLNAYLIVLEPDQKKKEHFVILFKMVTDNLNKEIKLIDEPCVELTESGGGFENNNEISIFMDITNKRNLLCNTYNDINDINDKHIYLNDTYRKIGGSTEEIKRLRKEIKDLEEQKTELENEYNRLFDRLKCLIVRTINLMLKNKIILDLTTLNLVKIGGGYCVKTKRYKIVK